MLLRVARKVVYLRSMGSRFLWFKVKSRFVKPRTSRHLPLDAFHGTGLEIGGPSAIFSTGGFLPVYESASRVDNVTFADHTRWEGCVGAGRNFVFNPKKEPGTQFILEGGDLSSLPAEGYDFIVSSHMLEHSANPLRVLLTWKRLLKPEGRLLLVLPHRDSSFDHRRPVTTLAHLVEDFESDRGEDDTTHFEEILSLHDLRRDPGQASASDFASWIRANAANRGAHHHVFDLNVSVQMLTEAGFRVAAVEAVMPLHIVVFATNPGDGNGVKNECFLNVETEPYRTSPFPSDRVSELVA